MTKRNGFRKFIVAALFTMWSPCLFAEDSSAKFGFVWGYGVPDANNTTAAHMFGFKGEGFINPNLSLGAYYVVSDNKGETNITNKFRFSMHGFQAAYHFPSSKGDTFLAYRMGMSKVVQTPSGIDTIYSPYHYGVAAGYDYNLFSHLTVGFDGSYLHVLKGRNEYNGVEHNQDAFNVLLVLISVQLRF